MNTCKHPRLQPEPGMEWLAAETPNGVCPTCGAVSTATSGDPR